MSDCPLIKENDDLKAKVKTYEEKVRNLKEQIRDMLSAVKNK